MKRKRIVNQNMITQRKNGNFQCDAKLHEKVFNGKMFSRITNQVKLPEIIKYFYNFFLVFNIKSAE